ncbi:MAG: ribosome maturation factor RimP [Acidimicrobiaceae bacterium]|nr:ribosome maturation factor RimP [Acidimicrobiaceae bacterium]
MSMTSHHQLDAMFSLIEPVVEASGHQLYDIQHNGGTLAVLVDCGDGIGIEQLAQLSRSVSKVLDEHDPIPGRYTLEVSTPGVERRLRNESHFSGAIGEIVNVRTTPEPDGRRRVVGTLVSVEGDTLTIDDANTGVTQIHLTQIEKARTVFEWGPAPKPGSTTGSNGLKHNHKGGSRE